MTDLKSRLTAMRSSVIALERLAAEEHREPARNLAQSILDDIDAAIADVTATRGREQPLAETFRSGGDVEVCPRCTLRSFRPQGPGEDDLYVCLSCGYRARREAPGNR